MSNKIVEELLVKAQEEEINKNPAEARKTFESIDEIAPGLVKASLARINFEKR